MVKVDDKPVRVTITMTTMESLAKKMQEKLGGLRLVLNRASEVIGPGDQQKSHVERLNRAIEFAREQGDEEQQAHMQSILDDYDGRGPIMVEFTVSGGAGSKGRPVDNFKVEAVDIEE